MKRWASVQALASYASSFKASFPADPFNGGVDTATAVKGAMTGAGPVLVQRVRDRIEQMDRIRPAYTRQWTRSVAGAYPDVPSALMGLPASMWHRSRERGSAEPMRIVVEMPCSSTVGVPELIERGAAASALAVRVSETRPVDFVIGWSLVNHGLPIRGCVPVPLKSLPHLAFALADPGFSRNLLLLAAYAQAGDLDHRDGLWLAHFGHPDRAALMHREMGLGPNDLFIEGGNRPFDPAPIIQMLGGVA